MKHMPVGMRFAFALCLVSCKAEGEMISRLRARSQSAAEAASELQHMLQDGFITENWGTVFPWWRG